MRFKKYQASTISILSLVLEGLSISTFSTSPSDTPCPAPPAGGAVGAVGVGVVGAVGAGNPGGVNAGGVNAGSVASMPERAWANILVGPVGTGRPIAAACSSKILSGSASNSAATDSFGGKDAKASMTLSGLISGGMAHHSFIHSFHFCIGKSPVNGSLGNSSISGSVTLL